MVIILWKTGQCQTPTLHHGKTNEELIMNIRVFLSCLILFLVASFSGCSKPTYLILYNNTNNDIEIRFSGEADTSFRVEKNSKIKILDPSYADVLYITINTKELYYSYKPKWPPKEYVEDVIGEKRIYYQIEPDGTIYIVADDKFPVKTFLVQPEGFPLKPSVGAGIQQSQNDSVKSPR